MPFMHPYVEHTQFYLVETTDGTECIPHDVCGTVNDPRDLQPYCEGTVDFDEDLPPAEQVPELKTGWIGRYSAPGYMDCTSWQWADFEAELWESLIDAYGSDEPGDVTYRHLPAHWAPYLINGDASGLPDEEQAECDAWQESEPELDMLSANCIGEAEFRTRNDAGTLAGDCCLFLFTIKGD